MAVEFLRGGGVGTNRKAAFGSVGDAFDTDDVTLFQTLIADAVGGPAETWPACSVSPRGGGCSAAEVAGLRRCVLTLPERSMRGRNGRPEADPDAGPDDVRGWRQLLERRRLRRTQPLALSAAAHKSPSAADEEVLSSYSTLSTRCRNDKLSAETQQTHCSAYPPFDRGTQKNCNKTFFRHRERLIFTQ